MAKHLRVVMSDGSKWDVPAQVIAEARAQHYATLDAERHDEDFDEVFRLELDLAFEDPGLIVAWAAHDMVWTDVKDHAVKVTGPSGASDYESDWRDGNKMIVDR